MSKGSEPGLPVLEPRLQVSFYYKLQSIKDLYLHAALSRAIDGLDLSVVDRELARLVPSTVLRRVASAGIRGEVLFPVPCVLNADPYLLGYYRLLLGFSQKEMYHKGPFGRYRRLEDMGELGRVGPTELENLCVSLIGSAARLAGGLDDLTLDGIKELQLLTLGPQLRGSENTRIGQRATKDVFELIRTIVGAYIREETSRTLVLENDSGRVVLVEFSSDPDIRITEKLASGIRPLVSVEIKGGADASNIHNRLGEAEKSHQKAKARGFFEFWTILRVGIPQSTAARESPTTSHFFHLEDVLKERSRQRAQFRDLLSSIVGMRV